MQQDHTVAGRSALGAYGPSRSRADAPSFDPVNVAEELPETPSTGERVLWFGGGLAVAVHVTVFLALATFALTTDALSKPATEGGSADSEVIIATEFAYALDPGERTSGNLQITMINEGAIFHNLLIAGEPGFVLEAQPGASATGSVELDAGTYVLYCSVPGHREAGMETTLTVAGPAN